MQVDAAYAGITCYNDPRLLKYRYKFSNLEIPIFVFKIFLAAGREQSLYSGIRIVFHRHPMDLVDREIDQIDCASTFELAPIPLWIEDLSKVKVLLMGWAQEGMVSPRVYLQEHEDCRAEIIRAVRVIKINRKTVTLYEADNAPHFLANLARIFSSETMDPLLGHLEDLWAGQQEFSSNTVHYTLKGRRLDVQRRGSILPGYEDSWSRVLIAVEDVTNLKLARPETALSEAYARDLFDYSPISLWVNDFSSVKRLLDGLRAEGVQDFRAAIAGSPDFVERCMTAVRVLDVNLQTLKLYGISHKADLWGKHLDLLRMNLQVDFREQLIGLWAGELFQERETINYRLGGVAVHVHLQFSVLPGHEDDWSLIQVARTDVTTRRNAENHLEHLRSHDTLTGLRSRSFYHEELKRLMEADTGLVTVVVGDLNGLKAANDQHGHAEGDEMLRRAGEVLAQVGTLAWSVARVGGDEFVILMEGADEKLGDQMMAKIQAHVRDDNHTLPKFLLSLSLGAATRRVGERLEATVSRADASMYAAKRLYYAQANHNRRGKMAKAQISDSNGTADRSHFTSPP